ncbi:hypothetical protein ACU4GD_37780 [Cupriavidus basilensis]
MVHLTLELPQAETLDYRPGQYLKIFAGDGIARSFSMASVPREPHGGPARAPHSRRLLYRTPAGQLALGRPGSTWNCHCGGFYFRKDDYRPLGDGGHRHRPRARSRASLNR